ncbi:abnormal spindle-like microcephaly-associated protein isoform X2 [Hemiscyllium ocellatum]|uniref:abnormal spindle-like microcephaly-associated protein isoform X2 n=1 Tax=Hemiscyllium ocellatum TaxID=170820 RepID=UPI0029661969|nr:abnormal spindle-like microcephaly-associated protein isoform X2 [Hemiscyllium ocellatum]
MELSSARRPHRSVPAVPAGGEDVPVPVPVPVLVLTHFARTPFVCFDSVRTGSSKTQILAVENPESVPVWVTIDKFPSSRGFTISEREFMVQPAEKYYLSITWTPVDVGGIRETVTFHVGCVKVLCILLGKAEDAPKKKRSLWESIKRKKASEGSGTLKPKRSASIASKTIIISQKVDTMKTGEPRSPLQSCENVGPVGDRVPPLHHCSTFHGPEILQLSPILPPGQIKEEFENCTPLSLKRSTTYSLLRSNGITMQNEMRLDCDKKPNALRTVETFAESGGNLVNQPMKEFSVQTPANLPCISAPHTPINGRRILSPDSFVNDSYVPEESPDVFVEPSVLSPDQFLKNTLETMNQSLPSLTQVQAVETTSNKIALQSRNSAKQKRSNESLSLEGTLGLFTPEKDSSPVISMEELGPPKSRLTFFVTSKTSNGHQRAQPTKQQALQSAAQTRLLPVYTTTGTKCNSVRPPELEKKVQLSRKEVIEVNANSSSHSVTIIQTDAEIRNPSLANQLSFSGRKRKSSEFLSQACEKDIVTNKRKSVQVEQLSRKSNVKKCRSFGGKSLQKRKSVSHVQATAPARIKPGRLMPGVAQSQFAFRKLTKTVIPRHPNPFSIGNMYYDEQWKEKQERGFTWWLNFILTPDDFTVNTESSRVNTATLFMGSEIQHHKISVPAAPTNEEMSLRAYTAKCRLNRLRRAACRLFASEGMVKVIHKLEAAIEAKHLLVRKDRYLWKDIGERQKVLKWLLSYNPLWLRIGLECIFGELIPLESNSDVVGLARFILNRLLWNSDIAAVFQHPTVPHLYRDEHQEVLAQFTLKKFLLLVWFLDCAKQSRLIDHDPCLFCKDAEFKTSKDLLLAFSRDFLSGEGDLSRHLSYFGLTVSHFQTPLHEFNFAITNIAVDLRCGVRLVRAVELLTRNWKLSTQLRVPAISRLQKLHNMDVALNALKTRGVDLRDERGSVIDSRDIVDGHREKTLSLLWRIIFAFQVEILLSEEQLQEEIEFLQKTLRTCHKLVALRSVPVLSQKSPKDQNLKDTPEKYSPRIKLLMNWVNAVCGYYGVKIENFTVAFSDGRVLCYLVHHYHPGLLAANDICSRTLQTVECAQRGTVAIDTSTSESDESSVDVIPTNLTSSSTRLFEELLENEKKNFNLVTTAVATLGGVPAMIRPADMSNTIPEEKVVITYVSFLCARLLDLRNETRAARIIQAAWRKYKLNCELQLLKEKNQAACVIQAAVRKFLCRQHVKKATNAALIIQKHWRGHMTRKKAQALMMMKMQAVQIEAATLLQAYWRRYAARRQLRRMQHSCILVQSHIRMKIAVTTYKRTKKAVITLQRHFRARQLALAERRNYLKFKQSAVTIQSAFRRWKTRKLKVQAKASVLLQKYIRGFLCRYKYKRFQRSIVMLQTYAKGYLVRSAINNKKKAVLTLQKHIKAYVTGKREYVSYQKLKWAAVVFQSAYRGVQARKLYCQTKSALVIQSTFRMYQQRKRFVAIRKMVITMQTSVRMRLAQIRYRKYRQAVINLQRRFRAKQQGLQEMQHYRKLGQAAVKLQVAFRRWQAQKKIRENKAAVKIQSWYRMCREKQKYLRQKESCIRIQSWYRCCVAQHAFCTVKIAVLVIQKYYRAYRARKAQNEKHMLMLKAVITIQAYFHGMKARRFAKELKAAYIIQSYWQMRKQRLKFLQSRQCAITIQAYVRKWQAQRRYCSMKAAACTIQTHFRAIAAKKKAQSEYNTLRSAAIVLQSAYRGLQARRQFWLLRSVVKIQSTFRGYASRKEFMKIKNAAIKIQASMKMVQVQKYYRSLKKSTLYIQRHYRAKRLGLETRKEYLKKREACVRLQSAIRLYLMQQQLSLWRESAVKIQSMFRMHRLRKQYLKIRCAVVIIQRKFRAYTEGVCQRQKFLRIKEAIICLQAGYKGYSVRKMIHLQHKAATKIQAAFRGHASRVKYSAMQNAVIAIQRWYRSSKVSQHQRVQYLNIRTAVIILQAAFRGMATREKLKVQYKAAVAIQTAFRKFRAQHQFVLLKNAALAVQRRFKAKIMGRKERQKYLRMCQSAIIIQAAYKGMMARKEYSRKWQACITIQSYFRMHKMCAKFQAMRCAALIIQNRFRAHVQRKYQRQRYQNIRSAAILLQASFRGMRSRKKVKEIHKAATIIQAAVRSFSSRKCYTTLRAASILLQRQFRALALSRKQRRTYLSIRGATLTIQAAYRGMKVRQEIRHRHKAATIIQSAFRMHRVCLPYQALRLATIIIQTHYRAHLQAKIYRDIYWKLRNSVLLIQAAYRGIIVRQHLRSMHKSATLIQSYYRMHKERQRYKRLCWAATAVQRKFRACKIRDACVKRYNDVKRATIHIQACFRGMKTRQEIRQICQAAVIIQRRIHAYNDRKRYLSLKTAAIVIQQRYRALLLTRIQQKNYSTIRNATISIQAAYRGMKARREIQCKHKAATVIQATFRMHRMHLPYRALKLAATIIQTHYRAHLQMKTDHNNYIKLCNGVRLIQSAYRGMMVRRHLRRLHKSATLIQSYYRMHKEQQRYKRLCWAATAVQQRYRACKVRDVCVKQYNDMKNAAIKFQAFYRKKKARDLAKRIKAIRRIISFLQMCVDRKFFLIQRSAVIVLQAAFRGHREKARYRAMCQAAISIQNWYRACKMGRLQLVQYQSMRQAAITIQTAYRCMVVRRCVKQKDAAVKIQSTFRMIQCRRSFLKIKSAAIVVQSHFRAREAQKLYKKYKLATTILQGYYRSYLLMKQHRSSYLIFRQLVIRLQARVRGNFAQRRYKMILQSTTKLQACYRRKKQRTIFLRNKRAACVIQQHYRAYCQRKVEQEKYFQMRHAAIVVQNAFRGYKVRQLARKARAAQKIQAWFKAQVERRRYKSILDSVIFIKQRLKTKRERLRFLRIRAATIVIQRRWRLTVATRRLQDENKRRTLAAIKVQAFWKGFRARNQLMKKHEAASQIQSAYRSYKQRKKFLQQKMAAMVIQRIYRTWRLAKTENMKYKKIREAVILLQSICRGWLVRKKLVEQKLAKKRLRFTAAVYHHLCAFKIQRMYKRYKALKSAQEAINSVIFIQRLFRTCLQRRRYLDDYHKIIVVQRTVKVWLMRRHKAAVVIQKVARHFLYKTRKQRFHSGVIKIQALWRGYCLRKKTNNLQIDTIRRHIEQANQNSTEEQKLCNRTAVALDYILKYKHFSHILAALKHLEAATRLSSICCENLARSGATPIILILIRSCNRSVPSMEVIKYAVQVLLNLSKYHRTSTVVYEVDNSINTLLDLLQMYRGKAGDKTSDKCSSIFTKVCCLLALLSKDSKRAMEIRNLPRAVDRILSIYELTMRKHKMDIDRMTVKLRMSTPCNGVSCIPATPIRTSLVSKLKPDWVLRRDNMKEIVDPLKAIQLVVDTLGISVLNVNNGK